MDATRGTALTDRGLQAFITSSPLSHAEPLVTVKSVYTPASHGVQEVRVLT